MNIENIYERVKLVPVKLDQRQLKLEQIINILDFHVSNIKSLHENMMEIE